MNEKETIDLGEKLGKLLFKGSFVTLKGDLASGKTTFTKGIGKGLNIKSVINSPTFTILKIYQGDLPLYHIDAYRLENNTYDLGLEEYENEGVMVVEWPEYYEDFIPDEHLEVILSHMNDDVRDISFKAHGDRYKEIVKELTC